MNKNELIKRIYTLSVNEQFELAETIAANCGYELIPETHRTENDEKIVPFNENFESVQSLLASIGEDKKVTAVLGFTVTYKGEMLKFHYNATRKEMAYAAAIFLRDCVSDE